MIAPSSKSLGVVDPCHAAGAQFGVVFVGDDATEDNRNIQSHLGQLGGDLGDDSQVAARQDGETHQVDVLNPEPLRRSGPT